MARSVFLSGMEKSMLYTKDYLAHLNQCVALDHHYGNGAKQTSPAPGSKPLKTIQKPISLAQHIKAG